MKKKTVLIVDDFPLIIERLLILLNNLDNIELVLSAGDFAQAIPILTNHSPDICVLDIHLPGRNGIELLKHIKKYYPSIVIIMLTNQTGEYYRDICMSIGADYFIDKSAEFEQVPGIISYLN